jgi:hypothetical protein
MAMPMRINLFRELNRQTQRSISHSAVNGLVNKKFQDGQSSSSVELVDRPKYFV